MSFWKCWFLSTFRENSLKCGTREWGWVLWVETVMRERQSRAGHSRRHAGPRPHPCGHTQPCGPDPFPWAIYSSPLGGPFFCLFVPDTRMKPWIWRESMELDKFWQLSILGDEEVLQREDISLDFDAKSSTIIYRFHSTGSEELTGNYTTLVTSCQKYTYLVDQVLSELLGKASQLHRERCGASL